MSLRKLVAGVLLGVALTAGCGEDPVQVEAHALVARGATLVDVRTPEEFAAGHIEGAINIPIDELHERMGEIGDNTQPVVVYCRSGNRSALAKRRLEAGGYTEVLDLGRMSRW